MNPETIRFIGKSISIWTRVYINEDKRYENRFQPVELTKLFLVCKTWHEALVPVLWECYDYELMAGVPFGQLKKNIHHVRYLSILGKEHKKDLALWNALQDIQGKLLCRLEIHDPTYPIKRLLPPIRVAHDPEAIEALTARPPPPPRIQPVIRLTRAQRRAATAATATRAAAADAGQTTTGGATTTNTTAEPRPADMEGALSYAHERIVAYGRTDNPDLALRMVLASLPLMRESELTQPPALAAASSSSAPPSATTTHAAQRRPVPQPPGTAPFPTVHGLPALNGNVTLTPSLPDPAPMPSAPLFRVCKKLTEFHVSGVKEPLHIGIQGFLERQKQLQSLGIERFTMTKSQWVEILKHKPELRRLVIGRQTELLEFDGRNLITLPVTHLDVQSDRIDTKGYRTMLRDCPELYHLSVSRPQVRRHEVSEKKAKNAKGKAKQLSSNALYNSIVHPQLVEKNNVKDVKEEDEEEDEEVAVESKDPNITNMARFSAVLKKHGKKLRSFEVTSNMPIWTAAIIDSLPKTLNTLIIHSNQLEGKMNKAINCRRAHLTTLVLDLGSGLSRKGRLCGVRRAVRDCYALKHLELHDHNTDTLIRRLLLRKSWATFDIETVKIYGVRGREKPVMMQCMPLKVKEANWNMQFIGKKYQCCDTREQDIPPSTIRYRVPGSVEPVAEEAAAVVEAQPAPAPASAPAPTRQRAAEPRYPLIDIRMMERLQVFPKLREIVVTDARYRRIVKVKKEEDEEEAA
ncbi:hypothetical protein BGW39_003762 [Mortierella sp. 14UC]|nr:hypothetical protein BGW39_003762 [Mortierella sp. 14UC]